MGEQDKYLDKAYWRISNVDYEPDLISRNGEVGKYKYRDYYRLSTQYLREAFEYSPFKGQIDISVSKLSYYTTQQLLPSPKKIGLQGESGGSRGLYFTKTLLMIWYINQLKKRGLNLEEMRLHIYNYFNGLYEPPVPVNTTPFEERMIYVLRENNIVPLRLYDYEDTLLTIGHSLTITSIIPCRILKSFKYEEDMIPIEAILIPKRNLTKQEASFLKNAKEDKKFLKRLGFPRYLDMQDGVTTSHIKSLTILDKYPQDYGFGDEERDYRSDLKTHYKFEDLSVNTLT